MIKLECLPLHLDGAALRGFPIEQSTEAAFHLRPHSNQISHATPLH
jgi:hypothetical protein